jgi:N4-bis(aminopropyl)spermidine synthase
MSIIPGHTKARISTILRDVRAQTEYALRADLDQCPATLDTVLRRAALLARRSSDILLIGDDDLLGLALAVNRARRRIAVLDADNGLLRLIRQFAPRGTVETAQCDLRNGLPVRMRGRFDEVFTDPPYTLAGQLVFVHRAACALRLTPGASIYLCASRAYMTDAHLRSVRGFLHLAGFQLAATYAEFNRYRAPADVRRDLKQRGWRRAAWLDSDLFHYVRCRPANPPPVPEGCIGAIYEY